MSDTTACPICGSNTTREFLNRAGVPVHQNLVMRDAQSARSIARGTLAMRVCQECGFVFNAAFDPTLLAYGEHYDNTQTCSPAFQEYVDSLVRHLIDERNVRGKRIVEVGCGKGAFLRQLVDDPSAMNEGWGFDPTYVGPNVVLQGRLQFQRSFFDASCTNVPADTVVCRHVIEHVPDPCSLLNTVRAALEANDATTASVFFETPCVDWIFRNGVLWDLFYEHCSLFTSASLADAFVQTGFTVTEARHVFGGQYLWLEATLATTKSPRFSTTSATTALATNAIAYGEQERQLTHDWRMEVQRWSNHGGVCLWGAGAKGVTFANLVDPNAEIIDCIVDVNPAKQGGFLPGTGHEIIAPEALGDRQLSAALVLNPNYSQEIQSLLDCIAPHVALIDLSANQLSHRSAHIA